MINHLLIAGLGLCCLSSFTGSETITQNRYRQAETSGCPQARTIHVFVALCDNVNQGIVPVPPEIGNGQEPASNLYWGAGYGVSTFFRKSRQWHFMGRQASQKPVLERLLFRSQSDSNVYLLADAYDGAFIRRCTQDFMDAAAGILPLEVKSTGQSFHFGSCSSLIAYVGHDGLMEFELDRYPEKADEQKREAIILACRSKYFFSEPLKKTGCEPLVWTKDLMAPEAYTLHDCVEAWIKKESKEKIRQKAVLAYEKYQKMKPGRANYLFSCSW